MRANKILKFWLAIQDPCSCRATPSEWVISGANTTNTVQYHRPLFLLPGHAMHLLPGVSGQTEFWQEAYRMLEKERLGCGSWKWIECHPQPIIQDLPMALNSGHRRKGTGRLRVTKPDYCIALRTPNFHKFDWCIMLNLFRRSDDAAAVPITRPVSKLQQVRVCSLSVERSSQRLTETDSCRRSQASKYFEYWSFCQTKPNSSTD